MVDTIKENKNKEEKPVSALVSDMGKKDEEDILPDYSSEEHDYIKKLQARLEKAKLLKDEIREEFDYNSIVAYFNANEKYANTQIENKKNKGETQFQSGTLRTKLMAFLNAYQRMNLTSEITAFGENNLPMSSLGNSFEDIIEKTEETDQDEEKKMLRQYEMLKHGSIFVEDTFEDQTETHKEISTGVLGQVKGVTIKVDEVTGKGRFVRRIISILGVYLGSWRKYFINDQPYLFTAEIWDRSDAEKVYGTWERWKYVSKKKRSFSGTTEELMLNNAWRLTGELKENQVERIIYQDKPNNEVQVILNGVVMLPMGYPLTALSPDGEYTLIQQNLEPIRHDFAIGKSFIFKNKNVGALLDEMMKLAVLKTQKSFLPPRFNNSGRIVTSRMFMPAQITKGFQPSEIPPVDAKEVEGVTNAEFNMIQEVMRFNDQNTASQTFMGAQEPGAKPTATQISALQRQAQMMMGIMELAASLLEKKLTQRRLMLIMRYWFDPIDKRVDEARNALINKYREPVLRMKYIQEAGPGARMTVTTDNLPSSDQVRAEEDRLEKIYGIPFRIIVLNPKMLKEAKITWQITVTSKPKKTSDLEKLLFADEVTQAKNLGLNINPQWLQQKFGEKWGEDPNKMFEQAPQGPPQATGKPGEGGAEQPVTTTRIKRPVNVTMQPE